MRVTIRDIREMKRQGKKIPMVTAYDYTSARIVEEAGVPLILVGDSLGQVILGYDSTVPVTMEDMLHHTKAVVRSTSRALVVADLPFMSYQVDRQQAMRNAGRMLQEAGAQAVKLEGGTRVASTVRRIVEAGIPVMGHIGLTPQSVNQIGGYRVQGKTSREAARLLEDALDLEAVGAFAIVLELVPAPLASLITQQLRVPTIGIGAGAGCDGQVQVFHDMVGLTTEFRPRHAKRYAEAADAMRGAVERYVDEVQSEAFPTSQHSSTMDESLLPEPSRKSRFEVPSV